MPSSNDPKDKRQKFASMPPINFAVRLLQMADKEKSRVVRAAGSIRGRLYGSSPLVSRWFWKVGRRPALSDIRLQNYSRPAWSKENVATPLRQRGELGILPWSTEDADWFEDA